ncbi:MAG: hypothetical protein HN999_00855 [Candidatus Marinimicrobia bacterium]|jgi:hypothetical protein|nr:hypothetical protein [Candidatus Neomarinimicrobiota bacterium]MBT4308344.1 hypothetical protein [Candidatus Neomarinimicrobiota bacterium]MBT6941738.1 hypothetical protein [Candidatus Neomarinimicrobiota bacterium]MBT7920853.1 hypothetical protein [Candidatus Neomarinimicrobiota bacterium]HCI16740.1 hypothetical protein [Candidatus Neomarinimicrobiota bacterium]|tara:strand:- start:1109 stop:1558 length:450 start_codon:yes stop_codon:yes gene_type:complete
MTEINQITPQNSLNYNLDSFGLLTLEKLIKWTKFVGIMNIITGALYCLTILIFFIPTAIMGVITIFMGTKLTNAANHLQFAAQNKDSISFTTAMDQFRSYFLINGVLLIITIAFLALCLILVIFFFGSIMELFNESGFDYSISAMLSLI